MCGKECHPLHLVLSQFGLQTTQTFFTMSPFEPSPLSLGLQVIKYQLHNTQCVASCLNNVPYYQSFYIHAVTLLLVLHVVVVEGLHLRLLISAPFDDLFMGNEISDCLPPCSKFSTQTRLLTQQVTSSYVKLV